MVSPSGAAISRRVIICQRWPKANSLVRWPSTKPGRRRASVPTPSSPRGGRDGFTLTGTKTFVRNAGVANVYIVFAALELAAEEDGLTAFVVDATAPGLPVGPEVETMGLKGCPVAHLTFLDGYLCQSTLCSAP
ncbi:MAG: acyl-CoA dehydrogenase family protein [Acetobacteraceae bacterium]